MFDFRKRGRGGGGYPLGRNFYLSPTFLCFENQDSDHTFREEVLGVRSPKTKGLIKKARDDISLTENLRVFRTDIPPKRSVGCPCNLSTSL